MLKEHSSFVKQAIASIDCILILVALSISYLTVAQIKSLSAFTDYWFMYVGFCIFYLYFAWTRQLFSVLQFSWMGGLLGRVSAIFVSAGILGAAILYMLPERINSRTLYIVFAVMSFVMIASEKLILRMIFTRLRRKNRNTTPILLFGRGRVAAVINKRINSHPEWGLRVVGKLDASLTPPAFEEVLKNSYVEEIFFCIPRSLNKQNFVIDPYLQICEEMGRSARVFLNLSTATHFAKWEYHRFMDHPTFISHTVELDPDQLLFKRIFDFCGALVGFAILVAFYPVLALAIKGTSKGPVFFRQVRVGRNGKRFVIYKFRSMYIDAEKRRKELESKNELRGAVFKMKNDPRITPLGKIMRKLSLDELPQFINVLKGEMSLVGTRPPTPDEVSLYEKWHHRRISIRPGITGLWQVSGRNKIEDFNEIVKLDLKYIDSWSIWKDLNIIFRTIAVVFSRDSAF